ncbi:hypothetical protein ANCCEY_06084 [Ancylostoma ceylanicum]|uniref:Uncharacterized protein n=1 Tax=Ancylostoma ceylanicum TaxID=53326 RepID=A0A0D6LXJ8_9BILA|nr:hypothetical protein ANCCEY_06084 [Ancylostoma ceylanicum]
MSVERRRITVSKDGHVAKIDEICARMHNNTALEGVDPVDMLQFSYIEKRGKELLKLLFYGRLSTIVYYYMHGETKHHHCYLFEHNSLHEKANLVKQNPENEKDVVRMLELAPNCHRFDSSPPLEEDDLVSSTDKFDRKKRRQSPFK